MRLPVVSLPQPSQVRPGNLRNKCICVLVMLFFDHSAFVVEMSELHGAERLAGAGRVFGAQLLAPLELIEPAGGVREDARAGDPGPRPAAVNSSPSHNTWQ